MNKTIETIGDATGETGWRKTYARKWTPPAQVCGAWRRKVEQTPDQIMQSALDAFGEQSQVDMVLEEGFELGKALLKLRRKKGTVEDVIDEIADGFVTLGQMRLLFGPEAVDERVKVKLTRLVRLVADQAQANAEKAEPVKLPEFCAEFDAWRTGDTPFPKPVKPVLRWEERTDGDTSGVMLWRHHVPIASVAKRADDGVWYGFPLHCDHVTAPTRAAAMKATTDAMGWNEVPLWTP